MGDLANERDAIRRKLEELTLEAVNSEALLPTGQQSWDALRDAIHSCDLFVLIVGDAYGYIPSDGPFSKLGKSVTELEYDEARAAGIPVLPFFKQRTFDAEPDDDEARRTREFRQRVSSWGDGQFRSEFRLAHDLADLVAHAVIQHLRQSHDFYRNFFPQISGSSAGEASRLTEFYEQGQQLEHLGSLSDEGNDVLLTPKRLLIVDDLSWWLGRRSRWQAGLANTLATRGHQVTYLTSRNGRNKLQPGGGIAVRVIELGTRIDDGIAPAAYALRLLQFGLATYAHLKRRGRDYDIVHTSAQPYIPLLAARGAQRQGGYLIAVDWHQVWDRAIRREVQGRARKAVSEHLQRRCVDVPQQAFCFTQAQARTLASEGLKSTPTVLGGTYVAPPELPRVSAAEAGIVFIGFLAPSNRPLLAVSALARARGVVPGLRGEFFGGGPEQENLERHIKELDLDDAVALEGWVPAATIDSALRRALCLLLTSHWEARTEVVLEAAARGTPCVVVPGHNNISAELVENGVNGYVARSDEPKDITDAIASVHEAGLDLRLSTAEWFRTKAERFSLPNSLRIAADWYARDYASPRAE